MASYQQNHSVHKFRNADWQDVIVLFTWQKYGRDYFHADYDGIEFKSVSKAGLIQQIRNHNNDKRR